MRHYLLLAYCIICIFIQTTLVIRFRARVSQFAVHFSLHFFGTNLVLNFSRISLKIFSKFEIFETKLVTLSRLLKTFKIKAKFSVFQHFLSKYFAALFAALVDYLNYLLISRENILSTEI